MISVSQRFFLSKLNLLVFMVIHAILKRTKVSTYISNKRCVLYLLDSTKVLKGLQLSTAIRQGKLFSFDKDTGL